MEEGKYYLVKNVRLLNVEENETKNCDILFVGPTKTTCSKILQIGSGCQVPEDRPTKIKMAGSRLCSRAFVDTACYLPNRSGGRQGEYYTQTVRAAQSGGFGTVLLLPSVGNPMDTPAAGGSVPT